ncbi:MAG: 1,4-alpha-glucan branching protein domain-containing protein [bacterium]
MGEFHGSCVIVLHCHLPWVLRHDSLEEEWLFEACSETYMPLLDVFHRLLGEGVSPKVSLTVSPVLAEQLCQDYFRERFREFCGRKAEFARRDREEFGGERGHIQYLAERWEEFYWSTLARFDETYGGDILGSFGELHRAGHVELITCGATHAYLPALAEDCSVAAQVEMAARNFRNHFGVHPGGIWLPECGYRPGGYWKPPTPGRQHEWGYERRGLEHFLSANDLRFFIVDGHQLQRAWPPGVIKNPMFAYWARGGSEPRGPVAVLSRDITLSLQVWRHEVGYPGDGSYLDFHKKHHPSRLRYWKITHDKLDMAYKHLYYPDDAIRQKIPEHAGHYKWLIAESLKANHSASGEPGMVLAAFDAELFGHWWFEGPLFLYHLIKWISQDPEISTETCSGVLGRLPPKADLYLPESSWGNNFDSSTWINPEVYWVLDREYDAEREMRSLTWEFGEKYGDEALARVLRQCARELMLLQASDWKFMITNWSTRDHGERRAVEHYNDFKRLAALAWKYGRGEWVDEGEWVFLHDCETRDGLFPDIVLSWYR